MKEIRVKNIHDCLICTLPGNTLYKGLKDRLFNTPGIFNIKQCQSCGLLWLDPRPEDEDIPLCYPEGYFRAIDGGAAKQYLERHESLVISGHAKDNTAFFPCLGEVFRRFASVRSWATYAEGRAVPRYKSDQDGLVIDVGCGTGNYLKTMQDLGWKVTGIEPSPIAAAIARNKGVHVFCGTLDRAGLADASAELVLLSHVIEHVADPGAVIKECFRILKHSGKLIVRTPNSRSYGHTVFKSDYYHLDPPRHLFLFCEKNLSMIFKANGFKIVDLRTIPRGCRSSYDHSMAIVKRGNTAMHAEAQEKGRILFAASESIRCLLGMDSGEEIALVAQKA